MASSSMILGVLLCAGFLTVASAAGNTTSSPSGGNATPSGSGSIYGVCASSVADCGALGRVFIFISNITSAPASNTEVIKNLCLQVKGVETCVKEVAKLQLCSGVPDIVKNYQNSVSIPSTCNKYIGGSGHALPNMAVVLASILTAMLVGKLELF